MVTSRQEMQWVLRAQCQDREALEDLLRSVQPSLRRYLSGLAGSSDADDLLQDVLVIIVRKLGMLDEPKLFRPWSFRIASGLEKCLLHEIQRVVGAGSQAPRQAV